MLGQNVVCSSADTIDETTLNFLFRKFGPRVIHLLQVNGLTVSERIQVYNGQGWKVRMYMEVCIY